jgi:hypothetical protein
VRGGRWVELGKNMKVNRITGEREGGEKKEMN